MTNVIECRSCGKVSERGEDFLDLCISVSGSSRLEDSLVRMFLEPEVLDASNRYRCDACGQLTDASKRTRLRHLPPILTISLLRFNFDPVKRERYKETGLFEFPPRLDMSCFCDPVTVTESNRIDPKKPSECRSCDKCCAEDCVLNGLGCGDKMGLSGTECGDSEDAKAKLCHTYELFSVVVHRGGAHGGHYHALIRDLECRGIWSEPEREPSSGAENPLPAPGPEAIPTNTDLSCPRSVITAILRESGGGVGLTIGDLAHLMSSLTGESWRKKFKPRHGSLEKFLADNGDLFLYDSAGGRFALAPNSEHKQADGSLEQLEIKGTDKLSAIPTDDPVPAVGKKKKKRVPEAKRREEPDLSSPRTLIASILLDAGGAAGLSVTDLCSKISDKTGDSWRKRYKPKHGSLVKFLTDNHDLFVHDVSGGWVSLLAGTGRDDIGSETAEKRPEISGNISDGFSVDVIQDPNVTSSVAETKPRSRRNRKKSRAKSSAAQESSTILPEEPTDSKVALSTLPEEHTPKPGHCWFDFNDTTVRPIQTCDIAKHFAGKECAYMLFYRSIPADVGGCTLKRVETPDWLISEITAENSVLQRQRDDYEEFVSMVAVEIHFGRSYEYREGVLRPRIGACYFLQYAVDVRITAGQLLEIVGELGGELVERCRTIHSAKTLPSGGLHLYHEITADLGSSLKSCSVVQSTKLFVWNGREVDGVAIPVGVENEPISLRYGLESSPEVFTIAVAKNTTVSALKALIANRLQLDSRENIRLSRSKENGTSCEPLSTDLSKTVTDAGLGPKDRIIVCHSESPSTFTTTWSRSPAKGCPKSLPKQITVYCENHVGTEVVTVTVDAESSSSVEELKVLIMTVADVPIEVVTEVRLRVRLDDLGIRGVGPPLHEAVDLSAARLSDCATLVLERGKAPQGNEITLTVSISASNELELTVGRDMAIHQLLHEVLLRAGVLEKGTEWHLCRSDWTGDAGAVLSEPNQAVGDAGLNHGDHLFLQPGCPPPPGFLKISIHLESSPARPCWWDPVRNMEATVVPYPVGSVVISKQSTLMELKQQVMTILPDFEVPSPQFLRLRTLTTSLHPTTILRQLSQTLNRMKMPTGCALGVEVLPVEEDLGGDQMLLTVRRRLPGERRYGDWAQEVVWDTSLGGATVASLQGVVADAIGENPSAIRMAKHIPDRFDWIIIPHSDDDWLRPEPPATGGVGGSKKKRKRRTKTETKPGGSVCDLKCAPFYLQDGDVIGVKVADEPGGDDGDFGSIEDDAGRERIGSHQKDSTPRHEACNRSDTTAASAPSRVETAIKIHVGNFR